MRKPGDKARMVKMRARRAPFTDARDGSAKKPSPAGVQVIWKATNDYRVSGALLLLGFTG
jgi:hypothetical protein